MKTIAIIVIAVLVIGGGYFLFFNNDSTSDTTPTSQVPAPGFDDVDEKIVLGEDPIMTEDPDENPTNTPTEHTVEFTSIGYRQDTLIIKSGDTVTFTNTISTKTWPASNQHPIHTAYPGSNINKCGSSSAIFDACTGLSNGESFSFTFNEVGTWNYHNHLRPSKGGTIIVQ